MEYRPFLFVNVTVDMCRLVEGIDIGMAAAAYKGVKESYDKTLVDLIRCPHQVRTTDQLLQNRIHGTFPIDFRAHLR